MKIFKRAASLALALLLVFTLLPSESLTAFAEAAASVKTGSEVQGFDANTVCTAPWGTDYANDPFGLAVGFSIIALGNITEPGNGSHMIGPAAAEGTITGLQQLTVEEGAINAELAINGWSTKALDRFNVAGILNNSRASDDISMIVKNGDLVYRTGTDYGKAEMIDSEGHIVAQANTQQFFDNARAYLTASEALLKSLPANGTVAADNWAVTFSGVADDNGVSVFDYTPSGTNGKAFVFDIPNDDSTVVIRVHGTNPSLAVSSAWYPNYSGMISYANPASAELVQRIIWVFDDNAEVKASGEIPGSILGTTASASLATNSSFNGTVVLKNFNAEAASAEIHWLPFRGGKKVAASGSITITKTGETEALDGTYTELSGAVFNIYNKNPDETQDAEPFIANLESGKTYSYDSKTEAVTQNGGTEGVLKISGIPVGEYWAKEVSAPAGYIKQDETVYLGKIEANGDEIDVPEIANDRIKGDLTIYKVGEASLSGTDMVPLKGVTYNIYRSDDADLQPEELVATETTDKNGKIFIENLPEGTYYAQEISAPDGYKVDSAAKFIGTISAGNTSINNEQSPFENTLYRGSVIVTKLDESDMPLSGVTFELYRKADNVFEWLINLGDVKIGEYTTDAGGKITVNNLPFGEYYLKETKALDGYKKLNSDIQLGQITAEKLELSKTVANEKIYGSAEIKKVDSNNNPISGVTFALYRVDKDGGNDLFIENLVEDTENPGTYVSTKLLEAGNYYVVETDAPNNYVLPTGDDARTELQELTESRTVITTANNKAIVNTEVEGSLVVVKKDGETGELLAGAEFTLYREGDTEFSKTAVSDKNGEVKFENLPAGGGYYIVETKAPDGYQLNSERITIDGIISRNNTVLSEKTVYNSPIKGTASVTKVDESGNPISGVTFTLYKEDDTSFTPRTAVTDSNGIASWSDLPLGKYYVVETDAPVDYVLPTGDDAKTELQELTAKRTSITAADGKAIVNRLAKGEITVVKQDSSDSSAVKYLSGAVFELYTADGVKVDTQTTGSDGKAVFTNVEAGSYYLVETSAPAGYVSVGRIDGTIVINRNNKTETIPVENSKIIGSASLKKVDQDGNPLAGVEFTLYKAEDPAFALTAVTDKKGKAEWTNLGAGTYYAKETVPPEGYTFDANTQYVIGKIETNGQHISRSENVVNTLITGSVVITKQGENSVSVDGIRFSLYKQAGVSPDTAADTLIGTKAVTGGTVSWDNLTIGTYYVVEDASGNANYAYNSDPISLGTISADNVRIVKTVNNSLVRGTVEITKKGENGEVLAGAEFDLYTADGTKVNTAPIVANANGYAEYSGLKVGNYYLVETKAPDGYKLEAGKKYEFTVARNAADTDAVVKVPVSVTNEKIVIYGSVTITKNGEDNVSVDGIRFSLYRQIGANPDTSADILIGIKAVSGGTVSWSDLPTGTYYAVEDASDNANYAYSSDIIVLGTISADNTKLSKTVDNYIAMGKVTIVKRSETDASARLENAEFELYDAGGTKIATLVTDENGYAEYSGLKVGSYYLVETKAPNGYVLPEGDAAKTEFAIVRSSENTAIGKQVDLVIDNAVGKGQATLTKVDADTGSALAGAVFGLYATEADAKNSVNAITVVTTGSDGKAVFTNLECGKTYYAAEISAPDGYITQRNVTPFAVTANGENYNIGIFRNAAIVGSVVIDKRDSAEKDLPLGGAVFELYNTQDDAANHTNAIASQTSATDGTVVFNNLRAGTYYVAEITPPYGYDLSNEILTVTVNADGTAGRYTYYNEKTVVYKVTYHSNNSQYNCIEEQSTDIPYYEDGAPWTVKTDVDNGSFNFRTPGYIFDGWYLTPDCTGEKLTPGDIHNIQGADVDIWASWVKNPGLPENRISLDVQHNYYLDGTNSEGSQAANMNDYAPAGSLIDASKLLKENFNDIDYSILGSITLIKTPITTDPDTLFPPTPETMYQFYPEYKALIDAAEKAKTADPEDMTNDAIEAEKATLGQLYQELDALVQAAAQAESDLAAANEALSAFAPADPDNLTEDEITKKNELQAAVDLANEAKTNADKAVSDKNSEIKFSEDTLAALKSQEVVNRYNEALKAVADMEASAEYAEKLAELNAKNAAEQKEYDDYITKMREWYGKDIQPETIVLKDGETFLYEMDYAYKLIYNYNRVTPPPTSIDPPVLDPDPDPIPEVPPVTPPPSSVTIPDNPIPTGSTPRRDTYTIADDDVPLGSLPNTSGKRAGAVGAAGMFSVIAGAILGIFGKKKKNDEEK